LLPAAVLAPPAGTGHGVLAEYFDNADLQGEPKLKRVESRPYLNVVMDPALAAAIPARGYSVRWTGSLTVPFTGDVAFTPRGGGPGRPAMRLFLDDKELAPPQNAGGPGRGRGGNAPFRAQLEAGHAYKLRVEYRPGPQQNVAELLWLPPAGALLAEAEAAVKNSDVTIAFVGLNPNLEGEEMPVSIPGFAGGDRTDLKLPENQEKLIQAAVATGKPVVVVLTSGSALAATYEAEHAAAILESWYNGEEAGTAIAETLAGINNPSGRLPVTFYRGVEQLPPFENYNMDGRTYRYFKGDSLWGFGFGLSYSKFAYSGIRAERNAGGAKVSVRVKNDSKAEGDEVAQMYFSGGSDAIRQLRGFQRVHLRPGESREVTFTISTADLPKDKVQVSVGGGQPTGGIAHVEASL
jgi:beta-glucosidase